MRPIHRLAAGFLTANVLAAGPALAHPRLAFEIKPQPAPDALIAFASQAKITLGGGLACHGRAAALSGRYTVTEGLTRLLAPTDCGFQVLDAHTVRIVRAAPPPPPPAPAPQPSAPARPEAPPADLSEVIVTATRRPTAEGRAPSAVTVITQDQLTARGAADTHDISQLVAGLSMTNLGPGRDKLMLRGLSDGAFTGRTQSTVGTYLDKVPLNYNAPDPDLYLADVKQVEVLRGPQGALYGGGSLAGVYRIVTRAPEPGVVYDSVSAEGALTHTGSPSYAFEVVANRPTPLGGAVRLVAYSEVRGGYLDDVNLRRSHVNETRRNGARIALALPLSPEWTLTLGAAGQMIRSSDAQYITQDDMAPRRRRANYIQESHLNRFGEVRATVEGSGSWGRFESSTALVRHNFSSRFDASAALADPDEDPLLLAVFDQPSRSVMAVEDATLFSPDDQRLQWLVGVFAMSSHEKINPALNIGSRRGGPLKQYYTEARSDDRNEVAVYGEASYALTSRWTVALGLRGFHTHIRTRSQVTVGWDGEGGDVFDQSAVFQGWSPKLILSYTAPSGALFYGLVSQGYRPGGFNTGGLYPLDRDSAMFSPDKLWNYEIGAKATFLDGRLKARGALFYERWSSLQSDQFDYLGLAYTTNVGDARNLGLETELTYRPTERLTIQANALFNRPSLGGDDFGADAETRKRFALPAVPDISGAVSVVYEHPLGHNRSLLFGADEAYIGRSRPTFDPDDSKQMGGYIASRLMLQFRTQRWRLSGVVDNPWNSSGDTFAFGNPFNFGESRQITPLRPRTFKLSLTASF